MKKNVVIRKFRKLINNPKAFFADAKIVKKVASNNSHNNDGNHGGKHVFGDIVLDGKVGLSIKTDCGCKPINYDFSSLLVKVRKVHFRKMNQFIQISSHTKMTLLDSGIITYFF
ncbi:hypothetical protein P8772_23650 [Escherichia coli]